MAPEEESYHQDCRREARQQTQRLRQSSQQEDQEGEIVIFFICWPQLILKF